MEKILSMPIYYFGVWSYMINKLKAKLEYI